MSVSKNDLKKHARELQKETGWKYMRCHNALRGAESHEQLNELLNELLAKELLE